MENINKQLTRVDLITGFLGAGKTSFITRYCDYLRRQQISFAVVENEYGMAGVDTAVLSSCGASVEELSGGCICCTLKVGFHDLLLRLSKQGVQRILVEPSGVYEAAQFFYIMESTALQACCEIGTVLCIVDPSALSYYNDSEMSFLAHQLCLSGGILLSRTQLLPEAIVHDALRQLGVLAPSTPVLCEKDWSQLSDSDFQRFSSLPVPRREYACADTDHSKLFQSVTLAPSHVYSASEATAALSRAIDGSCGQIFRIKGFVLTAAGMLYVNAVPGQVSVLPTTVSRKPMLNIIGLKLQRPALKALLV